MEQNTNYFILIFIISFTLAALSTPVVSKIAKKNEIVDLPDLRKAHKSPRPLLGGLAIFFGFSATIFFFLDIDEKLLSLVTATVVLLMTGLLDDIYNLKPLAKLFGQTASASIVVLWNAHLYAVMIDYFARFFIPSYIVLGMIIGWIVLMVNAFNLIDGLDGLAAGTAAIIFAAMAVLSIITGGNPNILGVQLIALGACLGFLIYNFYPAKIFMGDTGSMLLGFVLANVHLFTIKFPFSASLVLGSIFIFAYPALDITYALYRRICLRCSIFHADRGHIHHVLRSLGFSERGTVLLIYGFNFFFASVAVILLSLDVPARVLLVIGLITAITVLFLFWKLFQISERNGVNSGNIINSE